MRHDYIVRMCNLYSQTRNRDAIIRLFKVSSNRAEMVTPLQAIFPANLAPVVRLAPDRERELVNLNWGFVRRPPGRASSRVGNVRDDQIQTNPFWRESFVQRRCLVPASSYSEPQGEKPATWHWFTLDRPGDASARPLFAFAGIWNTYRGPVKKDGIDVVQDVYSFMTTLPNELTASINHERMPVLLTREEEFDAWLRGTPKDAFALARTFPAEHMHLVQSGLERRDKLEAMAAERDMPPADLFHQSS
jgi:putative SOS response-associated peptidase YedK